MEFELTQEQKLIQKEIRNICEDFGPDYWRERDRNHEFPQEFHETFADHGWYGLTVPQEYGGQGYGLQEGTIVQYEIARSGASYAGVSHTGSQIFDSAPLVKYGTEEQKERYLEDIANGDKLLCVGVTEPNAGLDTSRIETTAERDGDEYVVNGQKIWTSRAQVADLITLLVRTEPREESDRFGGLTLFMTPFDDEMDSVEVNEIPKAGHWTSDSNEVWFEDFRIPVEDRIGEEGEGFKYLMSFANAERLVVASGAAGLGMLALDTAVDYANERVVFGNEIGSYQAIQHPLADSWSKLQAAKLMIHKGAWLYDQDEDCGAEANAAKMRATEAAFEATQRAFRTHGGMGYSEEYDVARYLRESLVPLVAPLSNEMVKNYIGRHVLGLPRSY
jgi:acyl-CoA dehydrogenase